MNDHVIEVNNLSRNFGRKAALSNVSLNVPKGIVLGLVGENGAGKTTLIKHVLGLYDGQSGSVEVFGMNPVREPVRVLGRIGYLSEERDMPDWMRIAELMSYTEAFFGSWSAGYAQQLCDMFELDPGQKIRTLSRGQRALTGLLVALAHRPELLVLDEPSSGLDPVVRRDILGAIIRTVTDEGRTVLFSSHLLDEVERVADQTAMIHNGKIVLNDSVENIIGGHRRLTLRFRAPLTETPPLEGAIWWSGEGCEWSCLCNGEAEQLKQAALEFGAEVVEEEAASLDDIFVAHVKS